MNGEGKLAGLSLIRVCGGLVILMWADLLPSNFSDSDEEAERRLMYVALTRPEDMLVITYSGDSTFIGDIRNMGKVDVRRC
jgi:superfamily I DNA/RNA helicase